MGGLPISFNEFMGPNISGPACGADFHCGEPLAGGASFRLANPSCDPQSTTCVVQLVVPILFPGLREMACMSHPLIYWTVGADPPPCENVFPCPGTSCPTAGAGKLDWDRTETWLHTSVTCGNLAALPTGKFSINAQACPGVGGCRKVTAVRNLRFPPRAVGEAIGCFPAPPPPKSTCSACNCVAGESNPGGRGASVGDATGDLGPLDLGRGAKLRYHAGGAGHPGYPGSVEWRQKLGLYWSHDYAERIVEDQNETHVWLITKEAIFREFSDPDAGGVYQTVSPSNEYRTLVWLNPGWELRELNGTVHSFDAGGRWTSTRDRNGNQKTACYDPAPDCDGPGPLIAVDMPDGRREEFGYYSTGKLESIKEIGVNGSPTRTWKLTWNWGDRGDQLARIDRPGTTPLRFFYEVAGRPGYLSRIELVPIIVQNDPLPNRVLRAWEYDDYGNVSRTWKGAVDFDDGVDRWTLTYDDPVLPTSTTVTDPKGNEAVYTIGRDTVSDVPRIEGITGDCPVCDVGPNSTIAYDPDHPLLPRLITDGRGTKTEFVYDSHGQVRFKTEAQMGAQPRTTEWRYEGPFPSQVTEILVPSTSGIGDRVTAFEYHPTTGDLLERTVSGFEETFTPRSFTLTTVYRDYNAAGQPGEVDPPGYETAPTDVTTFTYDPDRGGLLPATRSDPLIGATTFGYDGFNRRTTITDPNDVTVETQYDAFDRVTQVIERGEIPARDQTTTYTYNRYGDLQRTTLPRGNVIEYGYDAAGRLTAVARKPDAGTRRERTFYTLDGAGNRTKEQLQHWDGAAFVDDAVTQYDYSTRCRLDRIVRAPGEPEESITSYDYDCNGNLDRAWDSFRDPAADPPSTTYAYDELDRLAQVRQVWGGPAGGEAVTDYGFDVQDHLTSVLDAEGNETTYAYSDRDLVTSETSPVSGTTSHRYNAHGELEQTTDARDAVTDRAIDPLDRVTAVTFTAPAEGGPPPPPPPFVDPSQGISYVYDDPAVPYSLGRLTEIARGGTSIAYEYDEFGRVIQDGELTYDYDKNGNRTSIGYPGGVTASYGFDFADRASSLSVGDGVNPVQAVVSQVTYAPFGPLAGLTLGNDVAETRDLDFRYQPTGISAGTLLDWDYATDGEGNVTAITDALDAANSRTFAYQPTQYHLTCAAGPWNAPGGDCAAVPPTGQPLQWSYDRIGNRLTEIRAGASDTYVYLENPCPVPPDPDRPCPRNTPILDEVQLAGGGSRQYSFGSAGHLEQILAGANQIDFTTEADGRLGSISRPAASERAGFDYDGRSFLAKAAAFPPGGVTIFEDGLETGDAGCWSSVVGSPGGGGGAGCFTGEAASTDAVYGSDGRLELLRKRDLPGGPERRHHLFYFAGRPVAQLGVDGGSSSWTYLTTDHLGTPVLATGSGGGLVWAGGFEPFGADYTAGPSAQEAGVFLRLPGQWDDETWQEAALGGEVFYNVHRWYQPAIGRYTKSDPLGDVPVTEPLQSPAIDLELFSPLYAYVGNHPTSYIDPLGLLRFKGCTPDQKQAIGPAFKDYCQRIEGPEFINCMCEKKSIPRKLKRLCGNPRVTVRCKQDSSGSCSGACGWSIPFGRTIRLCPSASKPGLCGPLGCTLMHEMTHMSSAGGETGPDQVEKCLGCP